MEQGTLAQAVEILTAQGVDQQQYKHLKPEAIIKLAGLQP